MSAKVSVIVPVYNGELYIESCIRNLLNQTLKEIEIIIVNDGSIDNTKHICEKYIKENENIILINQPNGGPSKARNKGLEIASGEYIGFMDVDDTLDRDMFLTLYNEINSSKSKVVLCNYNRKNSHCEMINKEWQIEDRLVLNKEQIINQLIRRLIGKKNEFYNDDLMLGVVWRGIYDKNIIENNKIRFKNELNISEDLIFNLEILLLSNKVSLISDRLYNYNYVESSLSNSFNTKKIDELLKKYELVCFWIESILKKNECHDKFINELSWRKRIYQQDIISSICNTKNNMNYYKKYIEVKRIVKQKNNNLLYEGIDMSKAKLNKKLVYYCFRNNISSIIFAYYLSVNTLKNLKILKKIKEDIFS